MTETTISRSSTSGDESLSLTTLLDVADGVLVRQMAMLLTGRDASHLSQLSRKWKHFMQIHEEDLFYGYLQHDFAEGPLLINAVKRRKEKQQERVKKGEVKGRTPFLSSSFSYKELYLAFCRRWKLPREKVEGVDDLDCTSVTEEGGPIVITWRNPYEFCEPPEEPSNDAQALVFIVRVGNVFGSNGPETCGLLRWGKDERRHLERGDRLVLDETWYCDDGSVALPMVKYQVRRWIDDWYFCRKDDIEEDVLASYLLTLHVVDLEKYQVATLMENAPPIHHYEDGRTATTTFKTLGHGIGSASLYGVRPPGSPFHQTFTEIARDDDPNYWSERNVDTLLLSGDFRFHRSFDNSRAKEADDTVAFSDKADQTTFELEEGTTLTRRDEICNFLRAVMKEKCQPVPTGSAAVSVAVPVTTIPLQPTWLSDIAVLDTVLSFSSFEQQAGDLRLVCRQFKDSAMRHLETRLLDKVRVICYDLWCDGWMKGSIRRGWSNDPFAVSKDSVIRESLYMALCHCAAFECPGMDHCPGSVKVEASGRRSDLFDRHEARKQLETHCRFDLDRNGKQSQELIGPRYVKLRFDEGEKSLFRVCDDLVEAMREEVSYELVPKSFQRDYGLSGDMCPAQFIRSLFLVFVHTPCKDNHAGESLTKRARLAQPLIAMAKSFVDGYLRMITIVRFNTASGEPVEILLECKRTVGPIECL